MVPKTGERYPKDLRIRKRSDYLEVQGNGQKVHSRSVLGLFVKREESSRQRLGITATRKFGPAVARNRFKRLVREAFRRGILVLPDGVDMVVIAKQSAADIESSTLFEELATLSKKARNALEATR